MIIGHKTLGSHVDSTILAEDFSGSVPEIIIVIVIVIDVSTTGHRPHNDVACVEIVRPNGNIFVRADIVLLFDIVHSYPQRER